MTIIVMLTLFTLLLALAHQKSGSTFRPRGRYAPSVAWGSLPALPRPELAARTRAESRGPATVRA